MELRKMILTVLHAGQQRRQMHKEQTFVLNGRRRWGNLRDSIEAYALPYVKQIVGGSLMYVAESKASAL